MWQQNYAPLAGSPALSTVVAALPILALLYLLGIKRKPSWMAALAGLAVAVVAALGLYGMPPTLLVSAVAYGAAFGIFPISWIVFWAILLYRITVDTGKFTVLKDSVGSLTTDRRLQALLIAFAFGAFVEGAAGFGTPVAVAAAMLAGLGFSPFYAAAICLLANTAPVAFGSIGIPVVTLAGITGLPLDRLSAGVGRICAPISLFVPAYLIMVMGGWSALRGVWPAAAICGGSFALVQLLVSNLLGPQLTDILSSLTAMVSLVLLLRFWRPADSFTLRDNSTPQAAARHHTSREVATAWAPYGLLVAFVLAWGMKPVSAALSSVTISWPWPFLHNLVMKMPPVANAPSPYGAVYTFNWLAASGTSCGCATLASALLLRMKPAEFGKAFRATFRQMLLPACTISGVLGLAFLMNYSGATATMGLALTSTGRLFPFFSAILGWLGVFLTGSDTSANALFGNLQVVTAHHLKLNEVLMAAGNSSGGVMGKMISLQSIAVAVAATGMHVSEEAKLFRFTLRHSVVLASAIGMVVLFYVYVMPQWAP